MKIFGIEIDLSELNPFKRKVHKVRVFKTFLERQRYFDRVKYFKKQEMKNNAIAKAIKLEAK
jgi:hypothetical protein